MSEYRRDFREAQREYYWSLPRIIVAFFVIMIAVGGIGWVVHLASQPARIISKTFDADNVIAKYEWFYDAYGNYRAKTSQVRQFKALLAGESDKQEQSRLRMEMAAIQQSCRDLTQRYNANAAKANQSIFMGHDTPSSLSQGDCE